MSQNRPRILLISHNQDLAFKIARFLKLQYSFENITMVVTEESAKRRIEENRKYDYVICDQVTSNWFPNENFYQIIWDAPKVKIVGILRDTPFDSER